MTINVQDRHHCLSDIIGDDVVLRSYGHIIVEQWQMLPKYYRCQTHDLVVMPDHVHGILEIVRAAVPSGPDHDPGACGQAPLQNLSFFIRAFKLFTARRINATKPGRSFMWLRSFYDRIIRNERELIAIRKYMADNPNRWAMRNITHTDH